MCNYIQLFNIIVYLCEIVYIHINIHNYTYKYIYILCHEEATLQRQCYKRATCTVV